MSKIKYFLLPLFIFLVLAGCSSKTSMLATERIINPTTLQEEKKEVLSDSGMYLITKDRQHVYIDNAILNEADPNTFGMIGLDYMKDKNHVYNNVGEVLQGVDPNTFTVIAKDNTDKLIIGGAVLAGADVATFHKMGDTAYFKDKNYAYHGYYYECWGSCPLMKIEGSDGQTFVIIQKMVAKDQNHVYVYGQKVNEADPNTFEIIDSSEKNDPNSGFPFITARDKNHMYKLQQIKGSFLPGFVIQE